MEKMEKRGRLLALEKARKSVVLVAIGIDI